MNIIVISTLEMNLAVISKLKMNIFVIYVVEMNVILISILEINIIFILFKPRLYSYFSHSAIYCPFVIDLCNLRIDCAFLLK